MLIGWFWINSAILNKFSLFWIIFLKFGWFWINLAYFSISWADFELICCFWINLVEFELILTYFSWYWIWLVWIKFSWILIGWYRINLADFELIWLNFNKKLPHFELFSWYWINLAPGLLSTPKAEKFEFDFFFIFWTEGGANGVIYTICWLRIKLGPFYFRQLEVEGPRYCCFVNFFQLF